MSLQSFIPQVWNARLLEYLQKELVYANLLNRDYEGDISEFGDTVKINELGQVSVFDYVTNTDMPAPETLSTEAQLLVIDKQKGFNFSVDDVDAAQIRSSVMEEAMSNSAYALADVADSYLANLLADKAAVNIAQTAITEENAYAMLVNLRTALNKARCPKAGRWVVMPPEFEGLMLLDTRLAGAYSNRSESQMTDGIIARVAGFDIYISENVPETGGAYKVLASTSMAGTYAEQIIKTEAYRIERQFGDAVKGLHVYGATVTRPNILASLEATF